MDIESIVVQRGLVQGTIEGHIAKLIENGEQIDWKNLITQEYFTHCEKLFDEHGFETLSSVVEASDGKIDYGKARIIRAVMQQNGGI